MLCSSYGGKEGRNGNVKEVVCVCAAVPPSAASAVIDLPLKLTSVAQSDSHETG